MITDLTVQTKDEAKCVCSFPFSVRGSVIDFETTGIPHRDPTHEIVTLGSLHSDKLTIIQRVSKDTASFYSHIREVLVDLPRPFFSYNAGFEKLMISTELRLEVQDSEFVDLMAPWKRKAEENALKWPRLDELIGEPEDYFQAQKVTGRDVPSLWRRFLAAPEIDWPLQRIMQHCFSDILREATQLVRYPYYYDNGRSLPPGPHVERMVR